MKIVMVFRLLIRGAGTLAASLTLVATVGSADASRAIEGKQRNQAEAAGQPATVTPVEGPSWIHHLAIPFGATAMGRTWTYGPPPTAEHDLRLVDRRSGSQTMGEPFRLGGADLYRLNCQACHKADGSGFPPEVASLISPVQGASASFTLQRFKELGRPVDEAFIRGVAASAEQDLRNRISNGGEKMPPFGRLQAGEVEALLSHLRKMAGIPGSGRSRQQVRESPSRVGEHLIKGTCQICHDAVGPRPDPAGLLDGAIPSLASIVQERTADEFIRKVREGAPITMGRVAVRYRGRMPVFDYVSEDEAAAAYLYLLNYPPERAPVDRPGSTP